MVCQRGRKSYIANRKSLMGASKCAANKIHDGALNSKLSSKSRMPRCREQSAGIFHARLAFEDDSIKSPMTAVEPSKTPAPSRAAVHARHFIPKKCTKTRLATVERKIAPPKPSQVLPGLMRGIILCGDERADSIRASVAEFVTDEVKDVNLRPRGKKLIFWMKFKQPRHIHQQTTSWRSPECPPCCCAKQIAARTNRARTG